MKMLKQRFRERSESWLSASTDRFVHPPHAPLVGEPHNPPVSILSHSTAAATTPPATNGQSILSTLPVIEHPPQQALLQSQQQQERPRKKLSFRDPEVTSMAGKDAAESTSAGQPHLTLLKDQGFSDSMENVDLEVYFISFIVGRSQKEKTRIRCL